MSFTKLNLRSKLTNAIRYILIITLSFLTFMYKYEYPQWLFWDENYHISAAEKYIRHIAFVEPHPPLGKLFIALWEKIVNPNKNIDKAYFVNTDYIREVPLQYSFKGVRFFPALFGALWGILFFLILITLTKNYFLSFVFSLAYIFDNALIVHFRWAMLDSILIFWILFTLYFFFKAIYAHQNLERKKYYILTGVWIALTTATKLNWLFLILLFLPLMKKSIQNALISILISILTFLSIFYIHFFLSDNINPTLKPALPSYYKQIVEQHKNKNPLYTPFLTYIYIKAGINYHEGVPKFQGYLSEWENGSLPMDWPLGIKSINYRWEKTADGKVKYLYLQANPVVRLIWLVGVILWLSLTITSFIFSPLLKPNQLTKSYIYNISILTLLYTAYMGGMILIPRVMYLYHYFPALIISVLISGTVASLLVKIYKISHNIQKLILVTLWFLIIAWWYIYSPLTYFKPISEKYFNKINIFKLWYLKPIKN